jgi:hypothetical protein
VLNNHRNIQSHERPNVRGQRAIGCNDQDKLLVTRQTDDDLFHALVQLAGCFINPADQRALFFVRNAAGWIRDRVETLRFPD